MSKKTTRVISLLFLDILGIVLSYYFALWFRFDGFIPEGYFNNFSNAIVFIVLLKVFVYYIFKLYKGLWEYASFEELLNILFAVLISNGVMLSFQFFYESTLPRSVYVLIFVFDLILACFVRYIYRVIKRIKKFIINRLKNKSKNLLIVGAGDAGALIIKEFKYNTMLDYNVIGFIDDDLNKKNSFLNGYKILGTCNDIISIVDNNQVDEIIISMPSVSGEKIKEIIKICNSTNAKVKILPGMYDLIDGNISINSIREVEIEDLLGRDPINLDTKIVEEFIKGKAVLVTGAGGSIGSELCRQIAKFKPKKLILLDIYENGVYDLQVELNNLYNSSISKSSLNMKVLIASVRDKKRLRNIFESEKPDIVFHAAAHKHVPLMEDSPCEAVKNNVMGTYNLISLAHELNIGKFVLISTDKAVNPTNVMGATKRFCEIITQAFAGISNTEFVAVRFGNVLGSNGSVIPLFKRQIQNGGPVTVTHKDIIRYFMTIPEASQLVLQAGSIAKGGEIFVLDMGKPVKIYELAKNLIKLSGFEPNKDIKIEFTGLRPGEKLYEELLLSEEGLKDTTHEKIYIAKPLNVDYNKVLEQIKILGETAELNEAELIVQELKRFVPTFVSNNIINDTFISGEK